MTIASLEPYTIQENLRLVTGLLYTPCMRLHRFLIDQKLIGPVLLVTNPELCHQWSKVLRLEVGDQVILVDGQGHECVCSIETLAPNSATVQLGAVTSTPDAALVPVTLYCALLKRENFEWVVQKTTELGVHTIVPILTERTIKIGAKLERLQKIAREATEQSGRGIVPIITEPMDFKKALSQAKEPTQYFFHTGPELSRSVVKESSNIGLWIGPEGGWSESEVEHARAHKCTLASLGPLVLRGETAAVVACYEALRK